MTDPIKLEAAVPLASAGARLDQVAAELFDNFSRSRLQQWIKSGDLLVDGKNTVLEINFSEAKTLLLMRC